MKALIFLFLCLVVAPISLLAQSPTPAPKPTGSKCLNMACVPDAGEVVLCRSIEQCRKKGCVDLSCKDVPADSNAPDCDAESDCFHRVCQGSGSSATCGRAEGGVFSDECSDNFACQSDSCSEWGNALPGGSRSGKCGPCSARDFGGGLGACDGKDLEAECDLGDGNKGYCLASDPRSSAPADDGKRVYCSVEPVGNGRSDRGRDAANPMHIGACGFACACFGNVPSISEYPRFPEDSSFEKIPELREDISESGDFE
jgi:hypothetical protein